MAVVLLFILCSRLFVGISSKLAVLNVIRKHASILVPRQRQITLCMQVILKFVWELHFFLFMVHHSGVEGVHGDVSFL